jgi:uncharacterized protein
MHVHTVALALLLNAHTSAAPVPRPDICLGASEPIIDVHSHMYARDGRWEAHAPNPATGVPLNVIGENALREATRAEFQRHGVIRALVDDDGLTGDIEVARRSVARDPRRMRLGIEVRIPTPEVLARIRSLHRAGELASIGEVMAQYYGAGPDDPRMEPLWALAEELDVPVGIHMGLGPPAVNEEYPEMRMRLGNPLLLEDVLVRHPRLRVYIMHAAWPHIDALLAMLHSFPHLYIDIAVIDWAIAPAEFYSYLKRIVDAGFGDRIMYGSDQMVWPDAVGISIERIRAASFLSYQQKRDILFNNAVRFFRWNDIAACGTQAPR